MLKTQDAVDILAMRQLFRLKVDGAITQAELEAEVAKIMSRQGRLGL